MDVSSVDDKRRRMYVEVEPREVEQRQVHDLVPAVAPIPDIVPGGVLAVDDHKRLKPL